MNNFSQSKLYTNIDEWSKYIIFYWEHVAVAVNHLKDDVIAYFCFPTLGVAVVDDDSNNAEDDNEEEVDSDEEDEDDSDEEDEDEDSDDDGNDDEDNYDSDGDYLHNYDSDGNCKINYDVNDDNDDSYDEDSDDQYNHFLSISDFDKDSDDEDSNDEDSNKEDSDSEDSDDEDLDKEDSDDEDSNEDSEDLSHDDLASNLGCLRTQLRIVQRLIFVLGPQFQVSYSPVSRPDFRETTTLQGCIGRTVVFCRFCFVDIPSVEELHFLCTDSLLGGFRLTL